MLEFNPLVVARPAGSYLGLCIVFKGKQQITLGLQVRTSPWDCNVCLVGTKVQVYYRSVMFYILLKR